MAKPGSVPPSPSPSNSQLGTLFPPRPPIYLPTTVMAAIITQTALTNHPMFPATPHFTNYHSNVSFDKHLLGGEAQAKKARREGLGAAIIAGSLQKENFSEKYFDVLKYAPPAQSPTRFLSTERRKDKRGIRSK